jgi:hypothetical protein
VWCTAEGQTESDARKITAASPCEAAGEWARLTDNESDFRIARGDDCEVRVLDEVGVVTLVSVYGEQTPAYFAAEVDRG